MEEDYLPVVVGAAVIGDHVLRLLFSDGTVGDLDFSSERWTGVLEPLNDSAYFARVEVDRGAGTVGWPGGIDLAPESLYEQAKAHPVAAADTGGSRSVEAPRLRSIVPIREPAVCSEPSPSEQWRYRYRVYPAQELPGS